MKNNYQFIKPEILKPFIIIVIYLLSTTYNCNCQYNSNNMLLDTIYNENIKTVLLHQKDDRLSEPIIYLHLGNQLTLSFDELSEEIKNYNYDFIHCDANWNPTDISSAEYIKGFTVNQINNYQYSFNTFRQYIHYEVDFPNDDIQLALSGNYVIKVYEEFNEDSIILTKKFHILDNKVNIEAEVKRPIISEHFDKGQQVSFKVTTNGYLINDPYSELLITIQQNNRVDNMITGVKPLFITSNEFNYDYHDQNIFQGGIEFRYFNIKSMRYFSEYIYNIEYIKPYYHVALVPGKAKTFDEYFYNDDINGKYYIDIQEGIDSDLDADYVYVDFTLSFDAPMIDGEIYIVGSLTNWELSSQSKMEYSFEKKAYTKTLLLKQGYYNYQYIYKMKGHEKGDLSLVEGSHHQAENDYQIFIYHNKPGGRYSELIGYSKINSVKVLE